MIRNVPYHEKVAAVLREEIRTRHSPGDRLPSDRAHAERFDVSVITIGKAMEQLAREGRVRRRQGSGTYVAAPPDRGRVALLVNDEILEGVASYFWLKITRIIRQELLADGFEVEMDLASAVPREKVRNVVGAIAIRAHSDSPSARHFLERNIPVVGHDTQYGYCVHYDPPGMVREGVRHLAEDGRERLAFLTSSPSGLSSAWLLEKFQEAVQGRAVGFRPEWTLAVAGDSAGGQAWDWVHRMWAAEGGRPDGLLVADDTLFPEVAMAMLSLGVEVPDDLMVVTHANRGSSMFCPFPVLKLENSPVRYAAAMTKMLQELVDGIEPCPRHVTVPFRTVESGPSRESPECPSGTGSRIAASSASEP
jgi:DNA-binding LacI/PurR family transcriptional regulator